MVILIIHIKKKSVILRDVPFSHLHTLFISGCSFTFLILLGTEKELANAGGDYENHQSTQDNRCANIKYKF